MFGSPGTPARASAGTSAATPHHPPVHTGRSGSPASNCTHTPAPICGTMNVPICFPAIGTLGMAHDEWVMPPASGTSTLMRPSCLGTAVVHDRPAIPSVVLGALCRQGVTVDPDEPMPPRARLKVCLYSPRFMLWLTLFT